MSVALSQTHRTDTVQVDDVHLPWFPVLMYHRVIPECPRREESGICLSVREFRSHLDRLADEGYEALTIDEAVRRAESGTALEKQVAITFDDGYLDTYEYALPLLQERGMAATVFVIASMLGGTNLWDRVHAQQAPLMTHSEVLNLHSAGMQVGAHSMTHRHMNLIDLESARQEIVRSKRVLEDLLGSDVSAFSFPYGKSTRAVRTAVRDAGYRSACSIEHSRFGTFNLSRIDGARLRSNGATWWYKLSGLHFRASRVKQYMLRPFQEMPPGTA